MAANMLFLLFQNRTSEVKLLVCNDTKFYVKIIFSTDPDLDLGNDIAESLRLSEDYKDNQVQSSNKN
jgi:hypothetical protein